MSMNFAEVANKKLADVERPPLPPVGSYRWRITKLPEVRTTPDERWDILEVNCQVVEPLDDVETDDFPGDLRKVMNRVSFMFDKEDEAAFEQTLFRARTFFERHVQCAEEGDTIAQAMNSSVGQEFVGTIVWKNDKNDQELFHANIGRTAPLD